MHVHTRSKRVATKTISIDLEAYKRLKGVKRPEESFSEAIKRLVRPIPDIERILAALSSNGFSDKTAKAVEDIVNTRGERSRRRAAGGIRRGRA
jgi:predicted CopG family antitoxin